MPPARKITFVVAVLAALSPGCKSKSSGSATPETDAAVPGPGDAPSPIERAVRDFVGDVRDERFERAYALMSSQYRATVPQDEFTRTVRGNAYFFKPKALDIYKTTSSGATSYADAVVETSSGTYRMFVYFTNEADGMRLTGLTVGGSEVLPRFAPPRPAPSSSAGKPGKL